MDNFTKLVTNHIDTDNGLLLIYENEARIMVQREVGYDPDYLITILGEAIRRDLEEYMPEGKDVYTGLMMALLDQVDFDVVATPLVMNAIEDIRDALEIEATNESLNRELQCAT